MSAALLYRVYGVRGYRYVRTNCRGAFVLIRIAHNSAKFRCSACGSARVNKAGLVPRRLRTLPIGRRPVYLELPVQRLCCKDCGQTRQTRLGFAEEGRSYTHRFERYALELGRKAREMVSRKTA